MLGKIPALIFPTKTDIRFVTWYLNLATNEPKQMKAKSRQKIRETKMLNMIRQNMKT